MRYLWNRSARRWIPAPPARPARRMQIVNRDAPFGGGVVSTADGRRYRSRRAWDEHLKAHGMVEIGNDIGPAPTDGGA